MLKRTINTPRIYLPIVCNILFSIEIAGASEASIPREYLPVVCSVLFYSIEIAEEIPRIFASSVQILIIDF